MNRRRDMAESITNGEGRKDDAGKLPWGLLPFDAVSEIVAVLRFGADKYGPRNWERGMDWSRPFDAMHRHLAAWWQGEQRDAETGLTHLAHAGCCLLFLLAYERRGAGRDDRPLRREDMRGAMPDGAMGVSPEARWQEGRQKSLEIQGENSQNMDGPKGVCTTAPGLSTTVKEEPPCL